MEGIITLFEGTCRTELGKRPVTITAQLLDDRIDVSAVIDETDSESVELGKYLVFIITKKLKEELKTSYRRMIEAEKEAEELSGLKPIK